MKKIATITFHAPHNYGSNLQAYALQEYVKKIAGNEYSYEIINLRTDKQKEQYSIYNRNSLGAKIVRTFFLKDYYKKARGKFEKFENFINNKLQITNEYKSEEELKQANLQYDYYISGSDQLWNLRANDFDWSYFLEFVNNGKKISYAASFGPKKMIWTDEEKQRVKADLEKYDYISVREEGSQNNVKELIGKEVPIHMDPTILLTKLEWNKIIPKDRIYKPKYILFYSLNHNKEYIELVKKVSKILNLPVVTTRFAGRRELFSGFEQIYDVGPIEFLNLLKNAELVLSSSFHGTIFSTILEVPFFAINGLKDYRISTLLKKMKLQDRSIETNNIEEKCQNYKNINFDATRELLNKEREKSTKYLKEALDIKS